VGELPTGTVTFLFTDVEGSTRLLQELGEGYANALIEHRRLLRHAFARHGGVEVDTQGDAFFVAFARASDAVAAAAEAQEALGGGPIRVRMGIHTGEPTLTTEGYVGLDVHRAARIAAAAHGSQVVLSHGTVELADGSFAVRDLGRHRLKDLTEPERLYQLGEQGFPPLRSLYATNLPVQPTPLVGRERELGEALELLRTHRLLTLTGPGGIGKTRLALQTAAELGDDFRDGVWFVSLASLHDPELVLPTVAKTLGIREPETVEGHLRERQALLLLDNFEQLLDAAASLAALLRGAPRSKLLVTSRSPLRVSGEQEYPVRPLADEEAVRLFIERARAAKPSFEADEAVMEICRRLDNLPLALELAAVRVKVLSPQALLLRLDQRLSVLTGGPRDLRERQQTLRSTIAWSYDLLSPEEQELFARLAVFAGGCTVKAAEAVADADVDLLEALVDNSLLSQTDDRFWMLETIREFGLELLDEANDSQDLRRRHARFYADLLRSRNDESAHYPFMPGRRLREVLAPDLDNVRTAVEWALAAGEVELALELVHASGALPLSAREIVGWYDRALGQADSVIPGTAARAYYDAAFNNVLLGQVTEAHWLCERSVALYRKLGDAPGEGGALRLLGTLSGRAGKPEAARHYFGRALAIADEHRLDHLRCSILHELGEFERDVGRPAQAGDLLMRSIELARAAGNLGLTGLALGGLGDLLLDEGDLDAADAQYLEAAAIGRDLKFDFMVMHCLGGLAATAAKRGDVDRAGKLWGAALAIEKEQETPLGVPERFRYERAVAAVAGTRFEAAMTAGETSDLDALVADLSSCA
jgi:predicted ATPase